ncbi:MAG: alpha/beta fold hydrolase [Pseudomonadota bacterium]
MRPLIAALVRLVVRLALLLVVLGAVTYAVLWMIFPSDPIDLEPSFDAASIGEDVDAYLATAEAGTPALKDGVEKRVIWAGDPGTKTDLAFVYIHGFSATSEEIRPVPDNVASYFNANLYYARLTGHGRDGPAMAEAEANNWIDDLAEAIAIGQRIGEKVILIGTSAGAALEVIAATSPDLADALTGVVLVSPAIELRSRYSWLLNWPGAHWFVPLLLGETRSFAPTNDDHAKYWTTQYPTRAIIPLAQIMQAARQADVSATSVPALFFISDEDQVIDPTASRNLAARWGAPHQIVPVVLGEDDDSSHHVIAGDIRSPDQTQAVTRRIIVWVSEL